ncbi:MAG: TPM domain-containing protein [Bdellovibrionaceae bacterium]|nr:TPM domain-containing protein [Pseudobdellovibrionaceae bacterium]MDW8189750.1 TPM domain-containing protein [Pseudobdellovibrionaceae bacterium]
MLSEKEKQSIRLRIREIEKKCRGEILVVLAEQVIPTRWVAYYSGLLMLLICGVFVESLSQKINLLLGMDHIAIQSALVAFILGMGYFLGYLVGRIPLVQYLFVPEKIKDLLVQMASLNYFLANSVSRTPSQSGVLIFVSVFEREVVLLVDEAIKKMVHQKQLDEIVGRALPYFRKGQWYVGTLNILEGVEGLLERFFPKPEHKENELHEELIILPSNFFLRS